jgi:hypothetical protein
MTTSSRCSPFANCWTYFIAGGEVSHAPTAVQTNQAEKDACGLGEDIPPAPALNGVATGQGSFDQAGRAMRHALAQEGWLAD